MGTERNERMSQREKPLLAVLKGRHRAPPPIWLMRQAGRYLPEYRALRAKARDFLDFCYTPDLAAEATLQPIRRFDLDAAIVFSDILVVPHALGRRVEFSEGIGPVLDPFSADEPLPGLNGKAFLAHLAPVYETLRRVRNKLPHGKTLIGFAGAPWTLACYVVQGRGAADTGRGRFEAAQAWAHRHRRRFDALIKLLCDAVVLHAVEQISAGAEVIQLFDSWAGQLSGDELDRWSIQPLVRVAYGIRAQKPDVPIMVFPRQTGERMLDYARSGAFDAVSIDGSVSLDFAATQLQPHVAVQGCLDPLTLVAGGAVLEQETRTILEALGKGRFIFNLAHGVVPETPPEHVAHLVSLVRQGKAGGGSP